MAMRCSSGAFSGRTRQRMLGVLPDPPDELAQLKSVIPEEAAFVIRPTCTTGHEIRDPDDYARLMRDNTC